MKQAIAVAVLAVVPMIACKKKEGEAPKQAPAPAVKEPVAPPEPAKPAPPPAPTGEQLAQRYAECWGFFNAKDWPQFESCYALNATSDLVDSGMPTAKGFKTIFEMHTKPIVDAMPDAKGDLELTLVNGKNAATIALFTGTQTGPLASPTGPVPPTKKKVGFRVAHTVHFTDDGKQVDSQVFYEDVGTMLGQLGISKAPVRPVVDKPAPAEVVIAKDDANEKRNLETLVKVNEAFNKHDTKAFEAFAGDSLMWSEIGMSSDWNKKQAIEAHDGLFKGFSDLRITPSTTWAAGDYVVEQGVFSGTNDGDVPPMKLKKTGKKVTLNFLQVYKFDKDGKVVGSWGYWNSAAFAMQLGLVPPPPPAKKPG